MSEGDPFEPDFKELFGANYGRLLRIKGKYAYEQIFYAIAAVGNDRWETKEDGRLCRKASD